MITRISKFVNRYRRLKLSKKQLQQGFIKVTRNTFISFLIVVTGLVGSGLIYLFGPWAKKTEAVWPAPYRTVPGFNDNWAYNLLGGAKNV